MSRTKYEQNLNKLIPGVSAREILSSGTVIARGVSAPYEKASTPCVTETFPLIEPKLQYVYTDALTGCAGLIAMSGEMDQPANTFKSSRVIIIHDKGGDRLRSSEKLLEDFIIAQRQQGLSRMRLIWGNGVVTKDTHKNHATDTEEMVNRLAKKYPHLDIKHLPGQTVLAADTKGNPINLSHPSLCDVTTMDPIIQKTSENGNLIRIERDFDRPYQNDFIPPQIAKPIQDPKEEIDSSLWKGKLPPIWLIQSEKDLQMYLNDKTAKMPMEGGQVTHYSELTDKINKHSDPLLQQIGKQLYEYKKKFTQCTLNGLSSKQSVLMSRKWWAMLFMATEIMEGLEQKPARKQLFDKSFFRESIPRSMDGVMSNAAALVDKADSKYIFPKTISMIDGSIKPEKTNTREALAQMKQTSGNETKKFAP